jgi:hypothetical protein
MFRVKVGVRVSARVRVRVRVEVRVRVRVRVRITGSTVTSIRSFSSSYCPFYTAKTPSLNTTHFQL